MSRAAARALAATVTLMLLGLGVAQDIILDPRVFEIGRELRCPTCVAESVSESNAAIAREMRRIIQEQLDEGRSRGEIIAFFQDRYGDWVLLDPPRRGLFLFVWLLPVAATLVAVAALAVLVRRWRTAAEEVAPLDPDDLARVRAALVDADAAPLPVPPTDAGSRAGHAPAPRR